MLCMTDNKLIICGKFLEMKMFRSGRGSIPKCLQEREEDHEKPQYIQYSSGRFKWEQPRQSPERRGYTVLRRREDERNWKLTQKYASDYIGKY